MSKETTSGVRSNFASRMLSKAMSERKPAESEKIKPADALQYATTAGVKKETEEATLSISK